MELRENIVESGKESRPKDSEKEQTSVEHENRTSQNIFEKFWPLLKGYQKSYAYNRQSTDRMAQSARI